MALTERGRVLTDVHRRRQMRIAIRADSSLRRAWRHLDVANIDATRGVWQQEAFRAIAQFHGTSTNEAVAYLGRYRAAEIGTRTGPVLTAPLSPQTSMSVLDAIGPQALKKRIAAGVMPDVAWLEVRDQVIAEAHKIIMAGGRGAVRESARQDRRAIGWRRVGGPDPCTFCAMLISRGPAYTTEARALAKHDGDDPYHTHCMCSVEIVYGDWQPTTQEQGFIDAYFDAAEAANDAGQPRTAGTVLHRMRERGEFRDSQSRRRKKSGN